MTITRETLELAAKAAGYNLYFWSDKCAFMDDPLHRLWRPEHDDGDSARLGTDLMLGCQFSETYVLVLSDKVAMYEFYDQHAEDKHKALRIARLRVAAEIGRRMP